MYDFMQKVLLVKNEMSVSAFARELGMQQKTVDLYIKGERKPSVEFVKNICSRFGVSADWLLGLPTTAGNATATGDHAQAVAGSNITINTGSPPLYSSPDCQHCKYKVFAEAFKAIQTPI